MSSFAHPESLNPLQCYSQARRALVKTSRARNRAWYQDALELDVQLHLRADGTTLTGWCYDRKAGTWKVLPELSPAVLTDPEEQEQFIRSTLDSRRKAGAKSLGIVFYVADEFAITEINPELEDPEELPQLRESIISDPSSVLADETLSADDTSWRLFPLPAIRESGFAVAITLPTTHAAFLAAFRDAGEAINFPVRTQALSAPLMALSALPFLIEQPVEKPLVAVLHYPQFTVMGFFNEQGDLAILRSLPHRGHRRPANLRHAAATTAALLEMTDPTVKVLSLAGFESDLLVEDIRLIFPTADAEAIPWRDHPVMKGRGESPLEALSATNSLAESGTPLSNNNTFSLWATGGWATQDFFPPSPEEVQAVPSWGEMRLMRASRLAHMAMAVLVVLLAAWICFEFIRIIQQPEWTFNPEDSKKIASQRGELTAEQSRFEKWDNLLADRSKAWANMELLARMFPNDSGVLVKSLEHKTTPDKIPGSASVGMEKNWVITGFATPETLERLSALNSRDGIARVFTEVAEVTGNEAFLPDLNSRTLVVSIRTEENRGYRQPNGEFNPSDESGYPYSFTLNLSQRFESSDPLALQVAGAPAKKP